MVHYGGDDVGKTFGNEMERAARGQVTSPKSEHMNQRPTKILGELTGGCFPCAQK